MITEIELLKPHTHRGRDYPAGSRLKLDDVKMRHESAAWLVSTGVARDASAELSTAAAPAEKGA